MRTGVMNRKLSTPRGTSGGWWTANAWSVALALSACSSLNPAQDAPKQTTESASVEPAVQMGAGGDKDAGSTGEPEPVASKAPSSPNSMLLITAEPEPMAAEPEPVPEPDPEVSVVADASVEPEAPIDAGVSSPDEDAGPPETCVGDHARSSAVKAALELLIDTSGSMSGSKLSITQDALAGAIAGMPPSVIVGLRHYPGYSEDYGMCQAGTELVTLAPLGATDSTQRMDLANALMSLTADGGTPTYEAYSSAFDTLASYAPPNNEPVSRFIVLLTDGSPGTPIDACALPSGQGVGPALVEVAGLALTQRIATFVLGSPGSDGARDVLSQMAEAGGTAQPGCSNDGPNYCHFDMTSGDDFAGMLADALTQVTSRAVSCDYPIPEPPSGKEVDLDKVNLQIIAEDGTEEDVLFSSDANCDEGWTYAGDSVHLCPSTCARVQADPALEVDVVFGCKTIVLPPEPEPEPEPMPEPVPPQPEPQPVVQPDPR